MQYVILNILCGLVFTQTLRYSQVRGAKDYVAGAVNYALAAVVSAAVLAVMVSWRSMPPLWPAGALGAACGASYFIQFLLILAAYRIAGVGITMTIGHMGILIPILMSWRFWGEEMTAWRWAALGLLPVAIVLIRPLRRGPGGLNWKTDVLLGMVLLNNGLMGTLHKAVNVCAPAGPGEKFLFFEPHQLVYQTFLFLVAAVCSVSYALARRGGCGRVEVALGSIIGVSNVLVTIFAIVGVGVLGVAIFYPTVTSSSIALTVVISWILWNERVRGRQIAGVLVALGIVVLVNL